MKDQSPKKSKNKIKVVKTVLSEKVDEIVMTMTLKVCPEKI